MLARILSVLMAGCLNWYWGWRDDYLVIGVGAMTTVARKHEDVAVTAHLLRRAGFGATRDQIDQFVAKGYEATVEELLNPAAGEPEDQDLMDRYFIASVEARSVGHADPQWSWRLATSKKPLEEKNRPVLAQSARSWRNKTGSRP